MYIIQKDTVFFCRDELNRLNNSLVAMDAVHYHVVADQYKRKFIDREITKCFAGFSQHPTESLVTEKLTIATGHWGCGVFKGDKLLKCILKNLIILISLFFISNTINVHALLIYLIWCSYIEVKKVIWVFIAFIT